MPFRSAEVRTDGCERWKEDRPNSDNFSLITKSRAPSLAKPEKNWAKSCEHSGFTVDIGSRVRAPGHWVGVKLLREIDLPILGADSSNETIRRFLLFDSLSKAPRFITPECVNRMLNLYLAWMLVECSENLKI